MNNTPSDFRTALDMDMAAKGLNERTLGDKLGVSQQSISKWRKRNFPPLYRLDQLREILGADSYVARMDFAQMVRDMPRTRLVAPSNVEVPAYSGTEPAAFTKTRVQLTPIGPAGAVWAAARPQQLPPAHALNDGFREWRIAQEARLERVLPFQLCKNYSQRTGDNVVRVGAKEAPAHFDYLSDKLAVEVKYLRKPSSALMVQLNQAACFQLLAACKWQQEKHGINLKPVIACIEFEVEEGHVDEDERLRRQRQYERAQLKFNEFCEVLGITTVSFSDTAHLAEYIAEAEGVELEPNMYEQADFVDNDLLSEMERSL